MTETNQMTVEGWVMNAYPITTLVSKGALLRQNVIEVFADTFIDSTQQRLHLNPQTMLIAYQSATAKTKFSLGFLQRIEIVAELQVWPVLTVYGLNENKRTRQSVADLERNWRRKTVKKRLRLYLNQIDHQLSRNQLAFANNKISFATYQAHQLAIGQIVGGHLYAHLLGLQRVQRRLWGEYAAKAQAHTRPLAVLAHARLQQIWPGPTTIETTTQPDGAIRFAQRSKLPLVNRRRVGHLAYQDQLLEPLRRGYQQWVNAGRPTAAPAGLPPLLAPEFAKWQQAHRSTDTAPRASTEME